MHGEAVKFTATKTPYI